MAISVVIPVRDDERAIRVLLAALAPFRGPAFEVVVVEADDSSIAAEVAQGADYWLRAPAGRAVQLQRGVDQSTHDYLWFIHADTDDIAAASAWLIERCSLTLKVQQWGWFDVRFDDSAPLLGLVPRFMNLRSRLTGIATGDQGIFVERALLEAVGGWPQQLLMEDVELSTRLRRHTPPSLPPSGVGRITTSARRWRANGVWRTIVLMWWLRIRYAFGSSPAQLHRLYYENGKAPAGD